MAPAQMNNIIFITDNSLAPEIAAVCQRILLREAREIPIISVSQKPIDFGRNICVGEIGRSWRSFYSQLLTALDHVETETVAIAEHDCLYTHEALAFEPPDLSVFWYNANCWLVQWGGNHPELNGMYSYWPRRIPFSQLTCSAALLRQSVEEIYRLLDMGLKLEKGARWYGEPGVIEGNVKKAAIEAGSGRCTQLQRYLKEYVTKYDHRTWTSTYPSLDIRHGTNFTGAKRGKKRTYDLPYWGKFEDVING
jgi:hypothetical protein